MPYNLEDYKTWLASQGKGDKWSNQWDSSFRPNETSRGWVHHLFGPSENNREAKELLLKWLAEVDEQSLDYWKAEVTRLTAQLADYETPTASISNPNETLANKLIRKRQELSNLRTNGRGSTAFLRKEIALLERIQALAQQISQLEARESNYLSQIQAKEQTIQTQQARLIQLESIVSGKQSQIAQLTQQLTTLRSEKQALETRMVSERQQALAQWQTEKSQLESQITTLTQEKNTSRQAADYLRTTLSSTETNKTELARQLAESQQQLAQKETEKQQATEAWQTQLNAKQEAYILIQARNSDLSGQLAGKGEENSKLTNWIERLEAASGQGNAFEGLQGELNEAQERVKELEAEKAKQPQPSQYYWVIALVVVIVLWMMLKQ